MLCARLLLLACTAACLARARTQVVCTHAKAGFLSGAPFHLAVTYLTPGLPDWKIAVPLPPPECAHGYVSGEEALVCDFDVQPYVRIVENGGILVHRNGYQQGYAIVNVTVFCAFPRYGPLPNLQGILEPPLRSLMPLHGLMEPKQGPAPAHEITILSKHSSSDATSTSAPTTLPEPIKASTSKPARASTTESASSTTTERIPTSTSGSSIESTLELKPAETTHRVEKSRRSVKVPLSWEESLPSSSEEDGPSKNERTLRRPAKLWLLPQEMFGRFMRYMHGNLRRAAAPAPWSSLHI